MFNLDDAAQYLVGTWLGIKVPTKSKVKYIPHFCQDVKSVPKDDQHPTGVQLRVTRNPDRKGTFISLNKEKVDIKIPELGAVNYNKTVLYLWRVPKRQWKRGLRTNIYKGINPSMDFERLCENKYTNANTLSTRLADAIWHPNRYTFKKSVELVKNLERYGAAFDKNWYIFAHPRYSVPIIGYKNNIWAGYVAENDDIILSKDCRHLEESLVEAVKE